MKKCLSIILVMILSMCLLFTGCEKNNANNNSSSGSTPAVLNNTENNNQEELNQIANNEQQEIKKTQVETGSYVCEYKNYIFYRNTNDNGSLYRYDTNDDSCIKLFDENANAFLHSIKVFDEKVYFVTKTDTDSSPTLYRISIDGGEAERLVENVCDDFAVTEDAIYYTGYQCPAHYGADYQLHKYTFADKKSDILLDLHCYKAFNLIDDKIYCAVINDDGTAYELAYFDIATQTTIKIDTGEVDGIQYAVSANDGKIIYFTSADALYSYNTATQKIAIIAENCNSMHNIRAVSDDLVYFTANRGEGKKIYQYKDKIISEYTELELISADRMEVVDGKPVFFNSSSVGENKIEGDDRLNIVAKQ